MFSRAMAYKIPLLFTVVVAFSALLLFRNSSFFSLSKSHNGKFIKIAENISRQGYLWLVPFANRKVELYVFLLRFGTDFLLIDAGVPGEGYAEFLVKGLQKKIGRGQLRLVVLTHGHIDHSGGLPALKQAFPDAHVVMHTGESPYLTGELLYKDVPSDHDKYDMVKHDVSAAVPESRVLHLRGGSGDVADAVSLTGRTPKWLPPRGALQFHHLPGHTPGQVAYLYKPSGSLIGGDTFTNMGHPAALGLPPQRVTPNMTQARLSAKALGELQYERAFCTHDTAPAGVTRPELQTWAESL